MDCRSDLIDRHDANGPMNQPNKKLPVGVARNHRIGAGRYRI